MNKALVCVIALFSAFAVAYGSPHSSYWEDMSKPCVSNNYFNVMRTPTPDGWLVVINKPGSGITSTYVPDAAHVWSGQ